MAKAGALVLVVMAVILEVCGALTAGGQGAGGACARCRDHGAESGRILGRGQTILHAGRAGASNSIG